jgi:amino acid transporter
MLATLAPAFNMINGYDGTLAFSEEVKGGGKAMARAVIICAALACICIIIPLIAALIAAPDLKDFFSAPNPVVYAVEMALGPKASALIDIGGAVALFNGLLAMLMYFGRAFYATGRDNVWPSFISRRLATVNRFRAPAAGVITITVPSIALIFLSALNFLLVFSGTIIAAVYFVIGLAAVWSRVANKNIHRPYRMPLWPLPPIIVVLFTGVALATQEKIYLLTEVLLILVALVAWRASHFWSGGNSVSGRPHMAEVGTDQQN